MIGLWFFACNSGKGNLLKEFRLYCERAIIGVLKLCDVVNEDGADQVAGRGQLPSWVDCSNGSQSSGKMIIGNAETYGWIAHGGAPFELV